MCPPCAMSLGEVNTKSTNVYSVGRLMAYSKKLAQRLSRPMLAASLNDDDTP